MVKLRWLKEWKIRKIGDVSNVAPAGAAEFVKNGYAEYMEEPKPKYVRKAISSMQKLETDYKKAIPNCMGADEELRKILDKPYAEQQQEVYSICQRFNVTKEFCNNVLKIAKEEVEKIKPQEPQTIVMTTQELENKGLIEYTETDDEFRKRIAKEYHEKFMLEGLRKAGILKFVDKMPQYKLDIKCKILALLDKEEFDRATEMLVVEIEKLFRIYTIRSDIKDEMLIYDDGIYIPEGQSYIKEFCRKILGTNYRDSLAKHIIDKIALDTLIAPDKFYGINNIEEVAIQNGILNIFTLELHDFNPDKIFFNKLPITFDLNKQCPKIEQFLKDVLLHEDDIKVFYELAGFSLLKEYRFEKSFMFSGDGRNGKGKAIELIKRFVGVDNCSALTLKHINPESPDISQLFGKFMNIAGDIGNDDLKDTSMFKSLTGRDLISARRKYMTNIHFQNYAKFVFSCNELPMAYDMSKGFWDRWILMEFPYTFVTQLELDKETNNNMLKLRDETIIDKISTDSEMSGFLNQALLGLERLLQNKRFSYTLGTEEVKSKWIRKSNSFMAFCNDNIEEDSESYVSKKELRRLYSGYCKKHKVTPRSDFVLKKVLQDNYGVIDERKEILKDVWDWTWVGIKLKKELK